MLFLTLSAIPALPVWILTGDLWLGLLVMVLVWIVIQFLRYIFVTTLRTVYHLLARLFIDENTGKKIDWDTLREYAESQPAFNKVFMKFFRTYL